MVAGLALSCLSQGERLRVDGGWVPARCVRAHPSFRRLFLDWVVGGIRVHFCQRGHALGRLAALALTFGGGILRCEGDVLCVGSPVSNI